MAWTKAKIGGKANTNLPTYECDTPADLTSLPKSPQGSEASIISTGDRYKANSGGQWIKQP